MARYKEEIFTNVSLYQKKLFTLFFGDRMIEQNTTVANEFQYRYILCNQVSIFSHRSKKDRCSLYERIKSFISNRGTDIQNSNAQHSKHIKMEAIKRKREM